MEATEAVLDGLGSSIGWQLAHRFQPKEMQLLSLDASLARKTLGWRYSAFRAGSDLMGRRIGTWHSLRVRIRAPCAWIRLRVTRLCRDRDPLLLSGLRRAFDAYAGRSRHVAAVECVCFTGAREPDRSHLSLRAQLCDSCLLVQVDSVAPPSEIFHDYVYFSSYSDSWLAHCRDYADMVIARFGLNAKSQVVEAASNDGYLLRNFVAAGIPRSAFSGGECRRSRARGRHSNGGCIF